MRNFEEDKSFNWDVNSKHNYIADLNYPNKTNKFEFSNMFFSNWVEIRQKVKRTKVA